MGNIRCRASDGNQVKCSLCYNYALQPMMCRLFMQLFLESILICLH